MTKPATQWRSSRGTDVAVNTNEGFDLLLETGFHLLLETGGKALLEDTTIVPKPPTLWVEL